MRLELGGVDAQGVDPQRVAGVSRDQEIFHAAVGEGLAHPGHVGPQRGHGAGGRGPVPQVLGHPVERHHLSGVDEEERDHRPLSPAAELDEAPAPLDLDGPKDPHRDVVDAEHDPAFRPVSPSDNAHTTGDNRHTTCSQPPPCIVGATDERTGRTMYERVLVVEDNERNRKLVLAVLEVAGMTVEARSSGAEALDRCATGDLDLVLLDIQLPDLDGVEVLHRLRASSDTANLPVVALTAFAMEGDEARFLAEGFDGYLTKPIDVRRFADQVREVLSGRVPS